jgi:hypothetical protein
MKKKKTPTWLFKDSDQVKEDEGIKHVPHMGGK